jgi:hypothetical protein
MNPVDAMLGHRATWKERVNGVLLGLGLLAIQALAIVVVGVGDAIVLWRNKEKYDKIG